MTYDDGYCRMHYEPHIMLPRISFRFDTFTNEENNFVLYVSVVENDEKCETHRTAVEIHNVTSHCCLQNSTIKNSSKTTVFYYLELKIHFP